MRIVFEGNEFVLVLSRRNLSALLAKLDGNPRDSACTIIGGTEAGGLIVRAEEDEVHYADRDAGLMHLDTERANTKVG